MVGLSWHDVSWIMLSDIVGTSVLTFPGVAHRLGWLMTTVFIVALFPAVLYTSILMSRTRELLHQRRNHQLGTFGEVAGALFGPTVGVIVYVAVYGYVVLGQASYLLVSSIRTY